LSKHSFNALLKTLEEPPPHVKFLLATTDPQKLPVTILSRCLQFNLKALSRTQISQQLDFVLGEEGIPFDKEALSQLARAAQGSMRDALSLTDQAIAQGNGVVGLQIVTDMLGLMDKNQVLKLVYSVVQKDSKKVMQQVEFMSNQAPDYALVLAEVMSLLHQIALTQFVPDACKLETISARAIFQLAKTVPAEQIQLLYQIALTGKKDLPHAVDARTGLEMTLLRMLAFCPNNLKLDALDIVANTPDVEVVLQQPNDQAKVNVTKGSITNDSASEMAHQSEATPETVSDAMDQKNVPVEVTDKNSPPFHQKSSAEPLSEIALEPSPEPLPEFSPEHSLELAQQQNNQSQTDQVEPKEAELFAQQHDILTQAENFGHQPIDYDQYQPVTLDEQASVEFAVDYDHTGTGLNASEDMAMQTQALDSSAHSSPHSSSQASTHQHTDTKPNTSTADLIALRNKLKQSKSDKEEGAEQVKKSKSATPFNLASIRKQNQEAESKSTAANDEKQSQDTQISLAQSAEPQVKLSPRADHTIDNAPPWAVDINSQASPIDIPSDRPVDTAMLEPTFAPVISPFSAEKVLVQAEAFDSKAHLDEENVGDVTIEIPAFLPNKQKVLKALQVDSWSQLIEDMQVTALTKQLALHSAFNQQGNTVKLTLLETKAHLISDTAEQQLKDAICLALNGPIELEIELGQPINTPYALQVKVNQVRKEYARDVVKNDPGIQLLKQQFAAKVDEQSIQAR
jgi:DNA polymerase-3 subunit gamma/tau